MKEGREGEQLVVKEGRGNLEATSEVFGGAMRHVRMCKNIHSQSPVGV